MCQYQAYYQGINGYIIRCPHCEQLQVAFGTMVMTFSEESFADFCKTIREYHTAYHDEGFPDQKSIRIPSGAVDIALAFSPSELNKLMNMLDETLVLMEAQFLLSR